MFSRIWSYPAKNEEVIQQKANFSPSYPPAPPTMTHVPPPNKNKRKRADSSPVSPHPEHVPQQRRTETMSHVKIPALEIQRATPPTQGVNVLGQQVPSAFSENQEQNARVLEGSKDQEGERFQDSRRQDKMENNLISEQNGIPKSRKRVVSQAALRQTFESQFSLEILLKHKELRLIDQELAKCQIALEQLRRCQIMPYPAMSSNYEDMERVSDGSGPVFGNRAPHAAPWGVVDGPYTEHYKRWLIPDASFDEDAVDHARVQSMNPSAISDRPTRGSKAEKGVAASMSRSQRGSNTRLKALPHGYPEPKEEKGPMIVKRSSDSHMVKLVCLDCRRSNFNSAQGFINHCRIAHARQFPSHDAAIEASGEEIDAETEGGVVETNSLPGTASAGLVHPLIRSAHNLSRPPPTEPATPLAKRKKTQSAASNNVGSSPNLPDPLALSTPRPNPSDTRFDNSTSMPLKPSPNAPHLSAYLARLGRGVDLDDLVTDAKTKPEVDLTQDSDYEEEDELMEDAPEEPATQSRSTRGILRGGYPSAHANKSSPSPPEHAMSSNDLNTTNPPPNTRHSHYPSYPPSHDPSDDPSPSHLSITPTNLSPNTTDPHPAPSLVSDDGECDHTHSESDSASASAEEEDEHYVHAEVIDHDELELGEGSSLNLAHPGKQHARRSRPSTAIRDEEAEERHVNFASPVRRLRRGSRAEGRK